MTETSTNERIEGLRQASAAARGQLPDELLDRADEAAMQAAERLGLAGGHTIVALAGATGSGKSSTFNALIGMDFSAVGVRRPTTSWTLSCVYGDDASAEPLLDWLGVPGRHRLSRESMLEPESADQDLDGLVLLDLPDHDSTELTHREQMEQMIRLADLIVWVLDPQKYADAALHEQFLKPLAHYEGSMLVALNHIDEVPIEGRVPLIDDLYRLLAADGLDDVTVVAMSAKYGEGVPELRQTIAERVQSKNAAMTRVLTDVDAAARDLASLTGDAPATSITDQASAKLVDEFVEAAGLPVVLRALDDGLRQKAARLTGWPPARLVRRLRRDPLKRVAFELGVDAEELTPQGRLSAPEASQVQHARVEAAVREVADEVTVGLSDTWAGAVRRASVAGIADVGPSLDVAIGQIDIGLRHVPAWWRMVAVLQWLSLAVCLGGLGWLLGWAASEQFDWGMSRPPEVAGVLVPVVLAVGGLAVGVLLALLSRSLNGKVILERTRAAETVTRANIGEVARSEVVEPMSREVEAYQATRRGLVRALSS